MKTRLGEIQLIDWIINKDLRKDDSQWKELLKETRLSLFKWSVKSVPSLKNKPQRERVAQCWLDRTHACMW